MINSVNHPLPPGRGSFKHTAAQLHSELKIRELTADSRSVKSGDTFVAYQGDRQDGRDYIADAIERGAGSIIWDSNDFVWPAQWAHVKHRPVAQLKENISELASVVYGSPSQKMRVVGVTGTNGKSTCSLWIAQLLSLQAVSCGLMGTLGNGIWPHLTSSVNTTLDAIECQKRLKQFSEAMCRDCVMEVSSHGLVQGRVRGINFIGAVFTNLTRDHLDYHLTMQAYGEAKALLFQACDLKWAVINIDDEFGRELFERYKNIIPKVMGYSVVPTDDPAVLFAANIKLDLYQTTFDVVDGGVARSVTAPILGRFNVANLLAVLAALKCLGLNLDQVIASLPKLQSPKGRLEKVLLNPGPVVVIDYAHTPDALEQVLLTLKELIPEPRKLICVVGCGGNRDAGKRLLMGEVADKFSDQVIITNDNPRDEDPLAIAEAIRKGVAVKEAKIILDRRQAIEFALNMATHNDVVLIAGKGHETYQEIKGIKSFFSDHEVVNQWSRGRG
jgi:UDP-N-acetylmuramoyl-L-alanyl-D-glutamate--2,6-diaminopimelate ligase